MSDSPPEPTKLLTVAGSDGGGAAGLQADLKTFAVLGAYGLSALTAVTAQNSLQVTAVRYLPAPFVAAQIDAALADYGARAAKTGFLGRPAIVAAVADRLRAHGLQTILVDPVLVNHRGEAMFPPSVVAAYRRHLLPLAALLTPNRAEAGLLTGRPVDTLADMAPAGRRLLDDGAHAVLITGGRRADRVVDVLCTADEVLELDAPWLDTRNTHGSGDTLSAAILVFWASGRPLPAAVRAGLRFTHEALRAARGWRLGGGHGPLAHWWAARAGKPEEPAG